MLHNNAVFINYALDPQFTPIFRAIVFCLLERGFTPRAAEEYLDSGEPRLHKIARLIQSCRYAIHDLSRVELSPDTQLPRLNMAFELGLFLGAKLFGVKEQQQKRCLITDSKKYRYQAMISDIAGQDIESHENQPKQAICVVRNWLQNTVYQTNQVILGDVKKFTANINVLMKSYRNFVIGKVFKHQT